MPASAWPSVPFWRVSSMRRDSERISFSIEFDRPARHRLGDGVADLGEFAAEGRDRLLDMIGALQRLDLARDLEQMTFQRGEIRTGRRGRHRRLSGMVLARQAPSARRAIGGALRGGIWRGGGPSSSFWRAAISAIAKSNEAGLSGGEGR